MEESTNPTRNLPPQDINVNPAPVTQQPTTPVEQPLPTESIQPVEKKSNKKIIMGILIGIGVVVALFSILFIFVNSATKAPLEASDNFLSGFANSDAGALYETTSTKFKDAVTVSEFESFFEQYKVLPFSDAKVTAKSIETKSSITVATFTYSLTYESENYEVETQMIKEGEDWKLLSMRVL